MKSSYIKILILFAMPALAQAQSQLQTSGLFNDIDPSAEALELEYRKHIVPTTDEHDNAMYEGSHEDGEIPSNTDNNTLLRGSHTAVDTQHYDDNETFSNGEKNERALLSQLTPSRSNVSTTTTQKMGTTAQEMVTANQSKIEQLYLRSLKIREKSLGPNHIDVATSLNNLADFYKENGQLNAAQGLYQRALQIMEKNLGPDHPDVASTLEKLANLYRRVSAVQ